MPVRTFLDSSVLLAAWKGDDLSHRAARTVLDDENRSFLASDIVRLEVIPHAVFGQRFGELAFYEQVFAAVEEIVLTDAAAVDRALQLASAFGLAAADACVAEAAIRLDADEFVSSERPTRPFFTITGPRTRFLSIHPGSNP